VNLKESYDSDLVDLINKKELVKLWRLKNGVTESEFNRFFALLEVSTVEHFSLNQLS